MWEGKSVVGVHRQCTITLTVLVTSLTSAHTLDNLAYRAMQCHNFQPIGAQSCTTPIPQVRNLNFSIYKTFLSHFPVAKQERVMYKQPLLRVFNFN